MYTSKPSSTIGNLYDTIGINYSNLRKPDQRIAKQIAHRLEGAKSLINVGAGSGSYEPKKQTVTAVEPSLEMIAQRKASKAKIIHAEAESLPFADDSFDAAMASLTIHHWKDKAKGVAEMRRVAKGKLLFFTFDPGFRDFWLFDYFPELITLDEKNMPTLTEFQDWLGDVKVSKVLIPKDCSDGFLAAYWKRPSAYLDERIRKAMSSFWKIEGVDTGLEALKEDLESGYWNEKYNHLENLDELDCGYRIIETD